MSIITRLAAFIETVYKNTGQRPGQIVITYKQFQELCKETNHGNDEFDPKMFYSFWGIPLLVTFPEAINGPSAIQSH